MIKEQALVIALDNNKVVLQTRRGSTCGTCAAKQSCGSTARVKGAGKHRTEIVITQNLDVQVGDTVIIGIEETALVQAAILLYLFPLIALVAGCIIGDYCSNAFGINGELLSIIFGVAGLASAALLTRYNAYFRHFQQRFEPVILSSFAAR